MTERTRSEHLDGCAMQQCIRCRRWETTTMDSTMCLSLSPVRAGWLKRNFDPHLKPKSPACDRRFKMLIARTPIAALAHIAPVLRLNGSALCR